MQLLAEFKKSAEARLQELQRQGLSGKDLHEQLGAHLYTVQEELFKKKFGADLKTPNDLSVPEYEGVYAYKMAVEKAGSTDTDKVIKALGEVVVEGPRGKIQMNKQRHAPLTIYLAQVQKDGSVKILETFKDVDPGDQCPKLK
jgi:ABC-type branched-subunit amino acid transport system substrate-binding protein